MKYTFLSGLLLLAVMLFVFSGCAPKKELDYAFDYDPYEKATKAFKQFKEQKVYELPDERILRIKGDTYLIYEDTLAAPVEFGSLSLQKGKVLFEGLKRSEQFKLTILPDENVSLRSPKTFWRLKPDYTEIFYRPQTVFEAIHWGNLEDLERLVADGALLDQRDALGSLPLIEAAYYNKPDIVEYLLLSGVDIMAHNYSGQTALHMAIIHNHQQVVNLLLEHGVKEQLEPCSDLLSALSQSSLSMMKQLIDKGYNPSCRQSTLLFSLLSRNDLDPKQQLHFLDYLLEHAVRTDAISLDRGDTPLMRAAGMGRADLVQRLIDAGVDLFYQDKQGRTALDYDSVYISRPGGTIEKILKDAGLNTGLKAKIDRDYDTANTLLKQGRALEAYWQFVKYSNEYGQERFFTARAQAAMQVKKPTLQILEDVITISKRTAAHPTRKDYAFLLGVYEKMKPLVKDEKRHDVNGAYAKDTLLYVLNQIDRLYDKMLRYRFTIKTLYKKYRNLKQMGSDAPMVRRDLSNGAGTRFVGESLHGKPFGKGSLKYRNGESYYGEVIHFKRQGKGKMLYRNGTMFDGMWRNDKRHGKGFFTDRKKALYIGTFKDDVLEGEATMVRPGRP